jgi:hypothetical protein
LLYFFICFCLRGYLCCVLVKLTHNFFFKVSFFRLIFFSFSFIDIRLLVLELCNFSFFPFHGVISSRGWVKLTGLTQFFFMFFYLSNFDLFSRSFFILIFYLSLISQVAINSSQPGLTRVFFCKQFFIWNWFFLISSFLVLHVSQVNLGWLEFFFHICLLT